LEERHVIGMRNLLDEYRGTTDKFERVTGVTLKLGENHMKRRTVECGWNTRSSQTIKGGMLCLW
jgi:hypothetical protein